jgi:hypothetical protein
MLGYLIVPSAGFVLAFGRCVRQVELRLIGRQCEIRSSFRRSRVESLDRFVIYSEERLGIRWKLLR